MSFIELMKEKARANKKTVVLPESNDSRTINAVAKILEEGTADLVLVGKEAEIKAAAAEIPTSAVS